MPDEAQQLPVGIDLGTTNSVVAYVDNAGRPVTIPNSSGELLTYSAVLIDDKDIVVGREALKSSPVSPEEFAECFKRSMGGAYYHRDLKGHQVPPEVLSGFLLEKLKKDAEDRIGPIQQVVITVPAFFDETRRWATQIAGGLAGLEVVDIINEPTAAAITFCHSLAESSEDTGPRKVLVYDLGGGTFDVSVLQIDGTSIDTIATDGDIRLGGKDFDERLVNHLAEEFKAAQGSDPRSDPHDTAQFWIDAEEAKRSLSEKSQTTVVCFHNGQRMRIDVTRDQFEQLTADLLERTRSTTELALRQALLSWGDIDDVLLVGGASRMPAVHRMLTEISGKTPNRSQSPDEAVAHGAALYAASLHPQTAGNNPIDVTNVNAHSLGVVAGQRATRQVNAVLIPRNTPLPVSKTRRFRTSHSDQKNVHLRIVEGESRDPDSCIDIGECVVTIQGISLPKGSPIDVTFRYETNGRLSVYTRILESRDSYSTEIQRSPRAHLDDIDFWRHTLLGTSRTPSDGSSIADFSLDVNRDGILGDLLAALGIHKTKKRFVERLNQHREMVRKTVRSMQSAEKTLRSLEKTPSDGQLESAQRMASIAAARDNLAKHQTDHDDAVLLLSKECSSAKSVPDECQELLKKLLSLC